MKIIYVHHAQRDKGHPSTQEDGITALGIKDAEIVAELLSKLNEKQKITAIYSSPFFRCMETSRIINLKINVPVFQEPRFNEFGSVALTLNNEASHKENWSSCQDRIKQALLDIIQNYDENDTIVCVTSGVNLSAFISLFYNIPSSDDLPFPLVPSCSPIGFDIKKSDFLSKL